MPFGTEITANGGVNFRLWAPTAQHVELLWTAATVPGQAAQSLRMHRSEAGWHHLELTEARAGDRYHYRIDAGLAVPDPVSRFQPDDVHGPSQIIDPLAFDWGAAESAWRGRPWHEAVIYELHVGTFSAGGDYASIESRFDHLLELGVTAIELMPLADFPGQRNWGYDGALLYAPDACYRQPEDLKRLIRAAHQHGLMVLLDVVYNHFGPEGNYLHCYAPAFFHPDRHTPWGAAIDLDGPQAHWVREFFIQNALYWLEEYRFDGLRLDAVDRIIDTSDPDLLDELAQRVQAGPGRARQIHLVLENDHNDARRYERTTKGQPRHFTAQWNDDLHHALHHLLTGETDGPYQDFVSDAGSSPGSSSTLQPSCSHGSASRSGSGSRSGSASRSGSGSCSIRPPFSVSLLNSSSSVDPSSGPAPGQATATAPCSVLESNARFEDRTTQLIARALTQGFAYQGEPSAFRDGHRRGTPSRHLPPAAMVNFLQNHDQAGNRAFGERLHQLIPTEALDAAFALMLLAPSPPLLFMGEEFDAESPFLFFCDFGPDLAEAVREGRRREFARSYGFTDPASRASIPDPNDPETFTRSRLDWRWRDHPGQAVHPDTDSAALSQQRRFSLCRRLLALRRAQIAPLIPLIEQGGDALVFGRGRLSVQWSTSDHHQLRLIANLNGEPVEMPREIKPPCRSSLILDHRPGTEPTTASETSGSTARVPIQKSHLAPWSVQWWISATAKNT
ncbi:MAG: alpha-amylase family glycosyl hydrolase [Lamprobacter sp.]|uniref:alpha-amylase family glycosyl hydrolase n=1 Tax=Lamprobacter sp. TaxID=3100796 RepID=UPI002B263478|nr:alpha-amylase family glycosyl hydrolase [Lamprobacter sp.]MEA3640420.1 alpha-amylase family glycosyl hydrolase [Lamprobacter sp.]